MRAVRFSQLCDWGFWLSCLWRCDVVWLQTSRRCTSMLPSLFRVKIRRMGLLISIFIFLQSRRGKKRLWT